jgi:DNA-binding IclR family transcriptional regulator
MSPGSEEAAAQHVVRTLRALEFFAEGPHTQADLAHRLEVHRRTARRLIGRLVEEGYLEPVSGSRRVSYAASPRLVVLGSRVASGLDLVAIAARHLAEVDAPAAGSRFLAMPDADGVSVIFTDDVGGVDSAPPDLDSIPLHATAAGKVLLSADNGLLERVLRGELLPFTHSTLVSRADLLLELATVRAQGFAYEREEHRVGEYAVASPVRNHAGDTVAAVGIGTTDATDLKSLGVELRAAAGLCSEAIGGMSQFPD